MLHNNIQWLAATNDATALRLSVTLALPWICDRRFLYSESRVVRLQRWQALLAMQRHSGTAATRRSHIIYIVYTKYYYENCY